MDLATLLAAGALQIESLSAHINNLPHTPTRIRDMGLFEEEGISSTIAMIGVSGDTLQLVESVPRGSPSKVVDIDDSALRPFKVPHLPQRSTVMADQLQGARTFGVPSGATGATNPEIESAASRIVALNGKHRRNIDFTIEYHRLGAIKGLILNSNGKTLFDLPREFGVQQPTEAFALATDATKVLIKVTSAKRKIETALGGIRPSGYHAFVGSDFMDKLVSHPLVVKAYERYMEGVKLRSDNRSGFEFGGVVFEEYQGKNGADALIDAGEGFMFPIGVPGMFITRFAPADYIETVNTEGLPYYSKARPFEFDKGVQMESQSNPLNLNTRPGAVVKLTTN